MALPPLIRFPSPPLSASLAGIPSVELKQHLVIFTPSPPGPKTTRKLLDAYFDRFGDNFVDYDDTWVAQERKPWNVHVRSWFFSSELPKLRQGPIWGYSWWDGKRTESRMLMFHGFKPVSQAEKASFFRFEFEWDLDPAELRAFTEDALNIVECVSAYGGYFFSPLPQGEGTVQAWDQVYAWAKRYWGVEVDDLDVSADHMLEGFKCVSWLTAIGPSIGEKDPVAMEAGAAAATWSTVARGGVLFQAGESPILGDRNRRADLSAYQRLARALLPLQVAKHQSFAAPYDCRWDDSETEAWLRRFTDPGTFSGAG